MVVLAIESTLDETGASVIGQLLPSRVDNKNQRVIEILSDIKASSAEIHAKYGGVIPEYAAREQVASIIPVITEAVEMASVEISQINAIAVTEGPGMIGCLLVGVETAKALALAWEKPLIAVNHMAAHVFANWIRPSPEATERQARWQAPELPAVGLVVSGGHTDIILLKSLTDWEWLGGTRDDAAGEAYDKAARVLGLPYPGGPAISRLAAQADSGQLTADSLKLPRPMIHEDNLDMSFSGLKTAFLQQVASNGIADDKQKALLARDFNDAVVEVLVSKTMKAVEQYTPKSVLLAGGVAANKRLREALADSCQQTAVKLFVPELKYCTDNAAMIGACAIMRPDYIDPLLLRPEPGLEVV